MRPQKPTSENHKSVLYFIPCIVSSLSRIALGISRSLLAQRRGFFVAVEGRGPFPIWLWEEEKSSVRDPLCTPAAEDTKKEEGVSVRGLLLYLPLLFPLSPGIFSPFRGRRRKTGGTFGLAGWQNGKTPPDMSRLENIFENIFMAMFIHRTPLKSAVEGDLQLHCAWRNEKKALGRNCQKVAAAESGWTSFIGSPIGRFAVLMPFPSSNPPAKTASSPRPPFACLCQIPSHPP